jgi:hypothetical protein
MHDYLSLAMMLQPIDETSLILFDVSNEEKGRIIRQYNRALANAQGDGTDVAQIFLKPLISQYEKWGDPALMFGLCLAREGQFKRAEGSLAYAIANVLQSEQYLTIAQEALRMVREDIKTPPEELPPVEISDKIKSAQMASGESPAQRTNFQAPILRRAQKEYEAVRSESREGVNLTEEELKRITAIVKPLVEKGQSLYAIWEEHKDELMCCERTLYSYVDKGLLEGVKNIDLVRKVKFRPRKKKKDTLKLDKKCRIGRTMQDFRKFRSENPYLPYTEIDSVEGKKGGAVLLTCHHVQAKFQLAFYREANDSRSVTNIFNELR